MTWVRRASCSRFLNVPLSLFYFYSFSPLKYFNILTVTHFWFNHYERQWTNLIFFITHFRDHFQVGYVQDVEVEDGMFLEMKTIAINPPVFGEKKKKSN